MRASTILTIGHSNHSLEKLVELLRLHAVTAVADVRSSPYSRANLHFNRAWLERQLEESGIVYVYLGRELGARPHDHGFYENGRVQYRKLSQSQLFRSGLELVFKAAQSYRLALLCAEKEPLACHRTLLVAKELVGLGIPVTHIHADGTLESHDAAMMRLIGFLGMSDEDLYRTREQIIEDACAMQQRRIAYLDVDLRKLAAAEKS
jgi:uncharacterized protein (DUF488 family)